MNPIVPLNLPKADLEISKKGGEYFIKCLVRKKKLVLTPEEWVRQHIIAALINHYQISLNLIAVEHKVDYNERSKRADIVVYNREAQPRLIIECKAPEVRVDQATVQQIAQYNAILNVEFLMLSNGLEHFFATIDHQGKVRALEEFPQIDLK